MRVSLRHTRITNSRSADLRGPLDWPIALFRQQHCDRFAELRGKNIACWCPLDEPSHVDVILELANAPQAPA
jgi:hypothetical protein